MRKPYMFRSVGNFFKTLLLAAIVISLYLFIGAFGAVGGLYLWCEFIGGPLVVFYIAYLLIKALQRAAGVSKQ